MRMWKVDPSRMCRVHLLGEHVEMHMFVGAINKGTRIDGYISRGLVEVHYIKARHLELALEMEGRGYQHKSPLPDFPVVEAGRVSTLDSERELSRRCKQCKFNQSTNRREVKMKINQDVLKVVVKDEIMAAIDLMNEQVYIVSVGKIRGKRHANKTDFATALVEKVLILADKGLPIPESVDVLVGQLSHPSDVPEKGESTKAAEEWTRSLVGKKEPEQKQYFEFLNGLRESGITNMFGAAPYLAKAFGIEKKKASTILKEWMQSFGKEPAIEVTKEQVAAEIKNILAGGPAGPIEKAGKVTEPLLDETKKAICDGTPWGDSKSNLPPETKGKDLEFQSPREGKKPKEPKTPKIPPVIQNGVRKPKPEGKCGQAWAIFDALREKNGEVVMAEALTWAAEGSLNLGNVRTEFPYWKKFHGIAKG